MSTESRRSTSSRSVVGTGRPSAICASWATPTDGTRYAPVRPSIPLNASVSSIIRTLLVASESKNETIGALARRVNADAPCAIDQASTCCWRVPMARRCCRAWIAPPPEPRPKPEELWGDEDAPDDLARQRWGIIAPAGERGDRLIDAIAPLVAQRRRQQGAVREYRVPERMTM